MLTYKGLAKINQYLPFHFNMILNPEDYPAEWKLVLQQMLDYMAFKQNLVPKHENEATRLADAQQQKDGAGKSKIEEDKKLQNLQKLRDQYAEECEEKIQQTNAMKQEAGSLRPQLETLQQDLQVKQTDRDSKAAEKQAITENVASTKSNIE